MNLSTTGLTLASDAAIDLHLHTTYSDGTWTPEQLLDHLVREQFDLVAITDHDRVDTVAAIQQLALEKHLPVLVGVEMSTVWKDEMSGIDELSGQDNMTDLLCYGFGPPPNALNDIARDLVRRQRENTREVFENLQRKGYTFPQDSRFFSSHPGTTQPTAALCTGRPLKKTWLWHRSTFGGENPFGGGLQVGGERFGRGGGGRSPEWGCVPHRPPRT